MQCVNPCLKDTLALGGLHNGNSQYYKIEKEGYKNVLLLKSLLFIMFIKKEHIKMIIAKKQASLNPFYLQDNQQNNYSTLQALSEYQQENPELPSRIVSRHLYVCLRQKIVPLQLNHYLFLNLGYAEISTFFSCLNFLIPIDKVYPICYNSTRNKTVWSY